MNYQTEKYIRKLFYDAQSGICLISDKPLYEDSFMQNTYNKISLDHDHTRRYSSPIRVSYRRMSLRKAL